MKTLVLFDVDGTLTKPRLSISEEMNNTLSKLKKVDNLNIGIVGGSNLNKQIEQLGENALNNFDWFFSENGLLSFKDGQEFHRRSISDYLGEEKIKLLINFSLNLLSTIDIPKKRGTFIEFRNGMINLSPIGRNCSYDDRLEFVEFNKKHGVLQHIVDELEKEFSTLNLKFSIGGQISIDIFPIGWDKTYCLQFVHEIYDKIYFFGDKTYKGGNDYEIYNDKRTEAYSVKSPDDTITYLNTIFSI